MLQQAELKFTEEYKYLGMLINSKLSDDNEMRKRMRGIYATGNMIIRNFGKCTTPCKINLFKTYCSNVYACALYANYRVATYAKLKIAHNDIFRSLLNVPRYNSASVLFVQHNVNNIDVILRVNVYSLMSRVLNSSNKIVTALRSSEARVYSRVWHRWNIVLGMEPY